MLVLRMHQLALEFLAVTNSLSWFKPTIHVHLKSFYGDAIPQGFLDSGEGVRNG